MSKSSYVSGACGSYSMIGSSLDLLALQQLGFLCLAFLLGLFVPRPDVGNATILGTVSSTDGRRQSQRICDRMSWQRREQLGRIRRVRSLSGLNFLGRPV